ncbi:LacI family transcriptional repressor [Treponema primitia ZAS-2]|uniref:LacI family transcriptional repressor n=1 Tax=Treponema primitia (strain ATCC BAA-887 / DSM 12427 / ZAS-2) TaxID=545694 RepID=F5YKG2_TREPZ|nr:LacI family DNA-binding transcriptional regulator [Treponema primitia]AEF83971.1 LacI family transcriptional repressor [Treponema primitia ZAS-2]
MISTKRLTIRDIAKISGVSYATVSRALTGSPGINSETRKQILGICDQVGYTTNYMARSLVVRKSKLLGFIVGSIDNPYMAQLAFQVELYARQRGYSLILCNSMHQEQHEAELFSLLMGRQVDGIIITPTNAESYELMDKYVEQIPTVVIGDNLKDERRSYVTVDNYQGAELGTEYLISMGHRSIVYIGHRQGSKTHQHRTEGYLNACKKHGLKTAVISNAAPSSSIEHGYTLGKNLLSGPHPYTAIFAGNDTTALGVMKAADELGIRIPEDISLIGFDNISYSMLPRINLTTIEQPLRTMAVSAVDMLIHNIEESAAGYSHIVLTPTLVKRGTCRLITGAGEEYQKENLHGQTI